MSKQTHEQKRLLYCTKVDEMTGCYIWIRKVSTDGFGQTMIKDSSGKVHLERAHHASYLAFYGEVPSGKKVRQSCGNPLCINPAHLELVVS